MCHVVYKELHFIFYDYCEVYTSQSSKMHVWCFHIITLSLYRLET